MKSKRVLDRMNVGDVLKIVIDHDCAVESLPKSHEGDGQTVLGVTQINDTDWEVVVRKER